MNVDVKKQINTAVETGKVTLGSNKTVDSLMNENPKLVLLSGNCPKKQRDAITYYAKIAGIPCVTLAETSIELGSVSGRPHPISAMTIIDEGDSTILEVKA